MAAKVNCDECTGCESCIEECPSEAIKMVNEKAQVEAAACVGCGVCVDVCPVEAIKME